MLVQAADGRDVSVPEDRPSAGVSAYTDAIVVHAAGAVADMLVNIRTACWLLGVATSAAAGGQVPESLLGTWEIDLARTVNAHMKEVARARPELFGIVERGAAAPAIDTGQASRQPPVVVVEITDDTIISRNRHTGSTEMRYRVIGGNSRLAILELTDGSGYQMVNQVRFVESGIAVRATDCLQHREWCEREMRRSAGPLSSQTAADGTGADLEAMASTVASAPTGEADADVAGAASPVPSQPRWIYFRAVADD